MFPLLCLLSYHSNHPGRFGYQKTVVSSLMLGLLVTLPHLDVREEELSDSKK